MSKRVAEARKIRDFYVEMMRQENPDFGFFSFQEARSAVATAPVPKLKEKKKPYSCETQGVDALDELFLGENRGTIELWETGSIINWTARVDGYPNRTQALEALVATWRAAEQWNKVLERRVTFRYVGRGDDAAFQLRYGGRSNQKYAKAFFPSKWRNTLNSVTVYSLQYQPAEKGQFVNTMLHELGHVLGLRHEHSQSEIRTSSGSLIEDEGPSESILWGIRNPRSIMAYYPAPTIQQSDIDGIRSAYDELEDGKVIQGKGLLGMVTKTIDRVEPNN